MQKKDFYSLTDSLKNETELRSEMVSLTELSEVLKAKAEELTAETEAVASRATALESQTAALATQVELKLDGAPVDGKAYIQKDGLWQEIDILGTPVGTLAYWPKSTPPAGWLEANGQAVDPALYPDLHAIYGDNLPDLRGEFVRGWDNGRGVDAGRALGSSQGDEFKEHTHTYKYQYGAVVSSSAGAFALADTRQEQVTLDSWILPVGGSETRPRNVAWMPIIKAFAAPVNQGGIDLTTVANRISAISNPNLLINGCFTVWQRGTTTDRYKFGVGSGASSCTRVANTSPASGAYAMKIERLTDDTFYSVIQKIENGIKLVGGQTVTISMWMKSNKTGSMAFILRDDDTATNIVNSDFTYHTANEWQKIETTVACPKSTGNTLTFYVLQPMYNICTDVGDWIEVTGVKLEISAAATPFLPDDPATNLAKCQRYYQIINNIHVHPFPQAGYSYVSMRVDMRAAPTVTPKYNLIGAGFSVHGNGIRVTKDSLADDYILWGDLVLDAEL